MSRRSKQKPVHPVIGANCRPSQRRTPSILLHVNPELVRDGYQTADWVADDRRHLLTTGMSGYTQNGVIGRPSLASAEKGKALLASLVESFASMLEILRRPLPEPGEPPGRSGE